MAHFRLEGAHCLLDIFHPCWLPHPTCVPRVGELQRSRTPFISRIIGASQFLDEAQRPQGDENLRLALTPFPIGESQMNSSQTDGRSGSGLPPGFPTGS